MRLEPAARLAVLRACDARRKVEAPGADGP